MKDWKLRWGPNWVIRGDFNDIKNNDEKRGGNKRTESSSRILGISLVKWEWVTSNTKGIHILGPIIGKGKVLSKRV